MTLLYIALIAAIAAGLVLLGRERRYSDDDYERLKGKGSGVGNALLTVQSIFEPDKKELLEARTEERAEEDDSGDPPRPDPEDARAGVR